MFTVLTGAGRVSSSLLCQCRQVSWNLPVFVLHFMQFPVSGYYYYDDYYCLVIPPPKP